MNYTYLLYVNFLHFNTTAIIKNKALSSQEAYNGPKKP